MVKVMSCYQLLRKRSERMESAAPLL
jgi:hypothetical protein